jgi:hypothetical protein
MISLMHKKLSILLTSNQTLIRRLPLFYLQSTGEEAPRLVEVGYFI